MILGTPHFNSLQQNISKSLFDSLLIVLKKFSPHQIAVQSLAPNYILYFSKVNDNHNKIIKDEVYKDTELGVLAQKKKKQIIKQQTQFQILCWVIF